MDKITFNNFSHPQLKRIAREYNEHMQINNISTLTKPKLIEQLEKHLFIDVDNIIKLKSELQNLNIKLPSTKKQTVQNKSAYELMLSNPFLMQNLPKETLESYKKMAEEYKPTKWDEKRKAKEAESMKKLIKEIEGKDINLNKESILEKKEKPKKEKKVKEVKEVKEKKTRKTKAMKLKEAEDAKYENITPDQGIKMIEELMKGIPSSGNLDIGKYFGAPKVEEVEIKEVEKEPKKKTKKEIITKKKLKEIEKAKANIKDIVKKQSKLKAKLPKIKSKKIGGNKPDVIFTRKAFIDEHTRLLKALYPFINKDKIIRDEYNEQKKELDDVLNNNLNEVKLTFSNWYKEHVKLTSKILNRYPALSEELKIQSNELKTRLKGGSKVNNYGLHAVLINKRIPLNDAKEKAKEFIKNHKFYRFRNIPKTKFIKSSFRTKKINKDISLIYGELKPEFIHLNGGGIFDFFSNIGKSISKGVEKVKNLFNLPDKLNRESQETLNKYGNEKIKSLKLMRTPISSVLDTVLNLISVGAWAKAKKKYNYDDMFHLSLIAQINNKNIMIEKNEAINITDKGFKVSDKSEFLDIPLNPYKDITLIELFNNAKKEWPEEYKMYEYDPFFNNCQIFLKNILKGSNLLTPEIDKWLFQPLESLVKSLPQSTINIAKKTTDIGSLFNKWFKGGVGGLPKKKQKVII